MSSASTQLITSRKMGIYDPFQQVSMWEDPFKGDISPNTGASTILQVDAGLPNKSEFNSHELTGPSRNDEEGNNTADKIAHQEFVTMLDSNSVKRAHVSTPVRRRLAQNREAARKSRLRKKAYVQQLETSRLKLAQLELELEKARKQGVYVSSALDTSHLGFSGNVNSGIAAFEMEYAHWVEEQNRQIFELRNALQAHVTEIELRMLVESGLNHYHNLFRMKADAAKADVFYLMSGVWRTTTERFFLWIGGFRPSELLNVLRPQLEPLTDQQVLSVCNLRQSSQQAEDALSLGMEKLQQSLAHSIGAESVLAGNYGSQMAAAMEKLEALEGFVNQADHLRQQTLQQMSRILTTHQAARGLLALGEYFHRLRALSSLWAARPREPE